MAEPTESARDVAARDLRASLRQIAPHLTDDQVEALILLADLYVARMHEVRAEEQFLAALAKAERKADG